MANNSKNVFPLHVTPFKVKKDDIPHVWLTNPVNSAALVIQLKCAELVVTPSLQLAGYTCRFPRIVNIRPDKTALDITGLEEVMELFRNPRAKTAATAILCSKKPSGESES